MYEITKDRRKIKFFLDTNKSFGCKYCREALKEIEEYYTRNEENYGSWNLEQKSKLKRIVLSPDYNASGILTHFHIELVEADDIEGVI